MAEVLRDDRLRAPARSQSKRTLLYVLVLATLVLATLPFWTSFQDVLTRLVMRIGWYKAIQDVIVPYELSVVGTLLRLIGVPVRVGNAYFEWTKSNGSNEAVFMIWNCVGWQTLVLFIITLLTGLSGKHTLTSKLETLAIGILGTYLINIGRLTLVVLVYYLIGRSLGTVFHDYFSNILTLVWLFWFWWFSFKYVLEEKMVKG